MTTVLMDVSNGVATITLNRPEKMNSLSTELLDELAGCLHIARNNQEIRSVILTGNGKAFSAGGDLSEIQSATGTELLRAGHAVLLQLFNMEKPVIAAVNGVAVGAAFNIALACDIIIASETATFGEVFNKIGLVPDFGGIYFLPRLVGMQRAKELMFSGRIISAKEALEYGIILEVTESDKLLEQVTKLATMLAQGPTFAYGMSKTILNRSFDLTLEQVLHEETFAQALAFTSEDHKEGIKAFFEKRSPVFKGK